MRVTYNWLKDFVEIKIPALELADKLTLAGLEVVSLEEKDGDFVFEIEITSNRPDWLSVLGIAREVAAITGKKLKRPLGVLSSRCHCEGAKRPKQSKKRDCFAPSGLAMTIEDKKDCPLYTARIIKNVKVASSPEWLKKRLELVGCRSVNNVVDITNYVLFELGEPLHAFDLDKIDSGKIIVRRAKAGEKILTIDGSENILSRDVLVIANQVKAIAVAGVMGAKDSEVDFNTRNILLEAAVFNPQVIRRSRQAIGKTSEASYRFERGIDLEMVNRASERASQLLEEICAGQEVSFTKKGLSQPKETQIDLEIAEIGKILGINLTAAKIKQILTGLGFKVKQKSKNIFSVKAPAFRQDVKQQVDLVEELARIFGFARIPNTVAYVKPELTGQTKRDLVSEIKNMLVGLGVSEAITYSLIDRRGLSDSGLGLGAKPIGIMNPLSQEQEILRPTLLLGLGRAISFNLNQKQEYAWLFEIAKIFQAGPEPQEELALGIALSGTRSFFTGQGRISDTAGLLALKGIFQTIFERLGMIDCEFIKQSGDLTDIYIQKEKIGRMLKLNHQALNLLEIKNRDVFLGEISLDKVFSFAQSNKKFTPLPKYPGITRDISFILKEGLSVKDVLALLKENGRPLLGEIKITDYYRGKQIPAGFRGLTLSCFYVSGERTLTEKEVQPVHDLLCDLLRRQFEAKLR